MVREGAPRELAAATHQEPAERARHDLSLKLMLGLEAQKRKLNDLRRTTRGSGDWIE